MKAWTISVVHVAYVPPQLMLEGTSLASPCLDFTVN